MDVVPSHPADLALRHAPFLRRLARHLVNDPETAEDLLQDTLVAALERGGGAASPPVAGERPSAPRAWLVRVMRNLAVERWRRADVRRAVELRSGRGGAGDEPRVPSTDERFAVQRALLDAIDTLGEKEREAILMRYFEELPPRRIASRLGVPVKTVNTRLNRALGRLRHRLDRSFGDERRTWVLALLPLTARRPFGLDTSLDALARAVRPSLVLGGSLVGIKLVTALCVASLATLLVWDAVRDSESTPDVVPPIVAVSEPEAIDEPVEPVREAESVREELAPMPAAVEPASTAKTARGRVVAVDAARTGTAEGVAGVSVFVASVYESGAGRRAAFPLSLAGAGNPAATSDAFGAFEVEFEEGGWILAADGDYVSLIVPSTYGLGAEDAPGPPDGAVREPECTLVVAPNRPLAGIVVDPDGEPVANVGFRLVHPDGMFARVDAVLSATELIETYAKAGPDGRFTIPRRPVVEGARLALRCEDYEPLDLDPPSDTALDMRIVMTPLESKSGVLEGVVVDPEGLPVAGAAVALGMRMTTTDEEGLFMFLLDQVAVADRLMAIDPRWAPVVEEGVPDAEGGYDWPDFVDLQFREPPAALEGVVLDADGAGVAGAWVWVLDMTKFAVSGSFPSFVEHRMADATLLWHHVSTDESGRFRMTGVMDRTYLLRAGDPRTAALTGDVEARPGEAAELRFAEDAVAEGVEGVVVDRFGEPIAGIQVAISRDAHQVADEDGMTWVSQLHGARAVTDADGHFVLEGVPYDGCEISARGNGIIAYERDLSREELEAGPTDLRIEVGVECHVRIEAAADFDADSVRVLDGTGTAVQVRRRDQDAVYVDIDAPLVDGRQTLTVPDYARTIVFSKDGEEVARMPLEPVRGELTYVRP